MRIRNAYLLLFFPLAAALSGCSGAQIDENDPAAMFKEAEEEVDSDHYQIAIDKFRAVKNKFPYSKYAVDAQLRIADVYFLQESFTEAAIAYETFRDLHPKHEKTPYAMFRIGKSYYSDIPSVHARDLVPAQKAVEAYGDFLKKFPQAPQAAEAQADLKEARSSLADKELYIADFYFKRDFFDSAEGRYRKILDLFPETAAADAAKKKLAQITQPKP